MRTAIRSLALASIVGMTMLAGNVSTAKAGPYWNRTQGYRHYYPGYGAYAYPYAYTPYGSRLPPLSGSQRHGFRSTADTPGGYTSGGYWGGRRGYYGGRGYYGRGWRR